MATVPLPSDSTTSTTSPTFDSIIDSFPYTPSSDAGKGFLPIFARTSGHILYLAARYGDTTKNRPTPAKAAEELAEAQSHWTNLVVDNSLSEKAKGEITTIGTALELASVNIESWDAETAALNTQKLANRMVQFMANLDREILGLRESDAGINL